MLGCVYGAPKFRPFRTYNHISGDSLERQVDIRKDIVRSLHEKQVTVQKSLLVVAHWKCLETSTLFY